MAMADEWSEYNGSWTDNPVDSGRDAGRGTDAGSDRAGDPGSGRGQSNVRVIRPPSRGMTVQELYDYQRWFTQYAADRIAGVGAREYDRGGEQKFESMGISQLVDGLREELADIVNYATMLDIQLDRWFKQFVRTEQA